MRKHLILMTVAATLLTSCGGSKTTTAEAEKFDYTVEQFADLQILRYKVPGFEELTLKQKELIYYLTEAALEGRDILFDQNGKYNLRIRRMLEAVYTNYQGDKTTPDFKNMEVYLKRVWFSNGIHHHYGTEKFVPNFSQEFLKQAVLGLDAKLLPLEKGQTADQLCAELFPVIFDPAVMPKRVNQADGEDLVLTSACNYYDGVTQKEAERFYSDMKDPKDETPVSYGLNSRLVKENGKLTEKVWKVGGLYTQAIEKIVYWLKKAEGVAENPEQKAVIAKLIEFYETGDLKTFDDYAILWVKDLDSRIDFVNGFTESYGDPLGMKASWESLVNFKDLEATRRTEIISSNAQWFEDHSPVEKQFKKEKVKGVSAKVITAAILAGDLYPSTAIGINLPNANWIRSHHGSKSVTIGNITDAYNKAAQGNGFRDEFVIDEETVALMNQYADIWNTTCQPIVFRYAEVLLNRAEAAMELAAVGSVTDDAGKNYVEEAFRCVNLIRERAGATLLASSAETSIDVVRIERRKELAFENKTYWDLKRWRIIDDEQSTRRYRTLQPFFAADAMKYFMDIKEQEYGYTYTYDTRNYYQQIPTGEITKNPNCKQNPGY